MRQGIKKQFASLMIIQFFHRYREVNNLSMPKINKIYICILPLMFLFIFNACGDEINENMIQVNANVDNQSQLESSSSEVEQSPFDEFVGFHQFTSVSLGTSIDDALSILGNPTSTITMDVFGTETTTKSWWTLNFFSLSTSETVTFTNGYASSVLSTADASSSISASDFNQVSSGMSELEVFEILGAPYSVTVIEIMGSISTTVMWVNPDFSSGMITFTNGTVSSTMVMGLN